MNKIRIASIVSDLTRKVGDDNSEIAESALWNLEDVERELARREKKLADTLRQEDEQL
jgi:hypothetical protein